MIRSYAWSFRVALITNNVITMLGLCLTDFIQASRHPYSACYNHDSWGQAERKHIYSRMFSSDLPIMLDVSLDSRSLPPSIIFFPGPVRRPCFAQLNEWVCHGFCSNKWYIPKANLPLLNWLLLLVALRWRWEGWLILVERFIQHPIPNRIPSSPSSDVQSLFGLERSTRDCPQIRG